MVILILPNSVVLVSREASKEGVIDVIGNTGTAATAKLAPTLFFVTSVNVRTPVIAAFKRTAFTLGSLLAAKKSHSSAAITSFGVASVNTGGLSD